MNIRISRSTIRRLELMKDWKDAALDPYRRRRRLRPNKSTPAFAGVDVPPTDYQFLLCDTHIPVQK